MDVNQGLYPLSEYPWDVPEDNPLAIGDVLTKAAANNAISFTIIIVCNVHQSKLYTDVLRSCSYDDIDELTWCKSTVGGRNPAPNERWVHATEHVITARSPKKVGVTRPKADYRNDGENAKARYNFFFGPDLRTKLRTVQNKVVNPYQRPDWLASSLAAPFVKPFGTAVVFGAGAGGDVQGLLDLGLNVIALEKDQGQYEQLSAALYTYEPKKSFLRGQTWAYVDNLVRLSREKIAASDDDEESFGEVESEEEDEVKGDAKESTKEAPAIEGDKAADEIKEKDVSHIVLYDLRLV